jgi:effector-binding domain-containing protein
VFSIGEFARHGRISIRMLRYYDSMGLLQPAGTAGPAIAYYDDAGNPGAVIVHAAVPVAIESGDAHGLSIVDLPEIATAATIIHHGSMDDVMPTGQALARWIDANGYQSVGYARELMVEWSPDKEQWVTELQQPVCPAGPDNTRP